MYLPDIFERKEVMELIKLALVEDLGHTGVDVTSESLVSPEALAAAHLVAREKCVVAGVLVAKQVFLEVNPSLEIEECVADGLVAEAGTTVLVVRGSAKSILTAERTALNFIQRMCGVATITARYVKAADNPDVDILCTRKTTPLLRPFEKYSVRCGGGVNHRYGLVDAVLIKDNHLASWERTHGIGVGEAVAAARAKYPNLKIEVEVDTIDQLKESLETSPDWVLLDNMPPSVLRECVALCRGICKTEASGGINLDTVYDIAQTGVDAISVGALTHSAPSIDLALDFV
ncbi:MAG: carboxylating nicotinate-nucleotide diphosphorylase [Kiritimatiellales bacterium]|nr:carboxylating nicotinate-nucleotide diphosphorylase [Kiritimatiellales bacterium]